MIVPIMPFAYTDLSKLILALLWSPHLSILDLDTTVHTPILNKRNFSSEFNT